MSAIRATRNGSKAFSTQAPDIAHLLTHGLAEEVKALYTSLYSALGLTYTQTVDEWDSPAAGSTLQLSYVPKICMGAARIVREIVNGSSITVTGTLVNVGGIWFYTPATPPGATPAVVTGSTDATAGALYGVGGTLDSTKAIVTGTTDVTASSLYGALGTLAGGGTGLTLILNVNGAGPITLTFDGAGLTNDANEAAMLAAIHSTWATITATVVGTNLILTDSLRGGSSSIVVGAGTANTALGLTPGTTTGVTSTLILNVDSGGALTLTLNGSTNTANLAALEAAIQAEWPSLTATITSTHLTLSDSVTGPASTITVGAGTSNTALGLTVATTTGLVAPSYAITYEIDGTQLPIVRSPTGGYFAPGVGSPYQP